MTGCPRLRILLLVVYVYCQYLHLQQYSSLCCSSSLSYFSTHSSKVLDALHIPIILANVAAFFLGKIKTNQV